MRLDPQARALLEQLAAAGGPELSELEPDAARQVYGEMRAPERGEETTRVENLRLASRERTIGLRVYVPAPDPPSGSTRARRRSARSPRPCARPLPRAATGRAKAAGPKRNRARRSARYAIG